MNTLLRIVFSHLQKTRHKNETKSEVYCCATIFSRPPSSTTVPKRLRASSAFEKRERARVTYSYYSITAQSHYWSVRYSLRLLLLVWMPLQVQMQYLSYRWIEPELMILNVCYWSGIYSSGHVVVCNNCRMNCLFLNLWVFRLFP